MHLVNNNAPARKHWSEKYVGISYKENDCAELALKVQKNEFSKNIDLPGHREKGLRNLSNQIQNLQGDYAEPTEQPSEGDAVLMKSRGQLNHIGIYCFINNEAFVLHAMRNAGCVCLHRLRDLENIGLSIEGFYQWK